MKILMILPHDSTYQYNGSFTKAISYAPLTLSVLAALIPKHLNAEITLIDEGVSKPVTSGFYDIVAITCVTASANRGYALCHYWKQRGSYVLLGGVHPTFMPQEALIHCDSVFIGLAEDSFPLFFEDYISGKPKRIYQSEIEKKQCSMPIPSRELMSSNYLKIPTVIANRGCQNNCSYCSIPNLWGKKGLTRPIEEVIQEIKSLNKKRIILLDPSPTSNRDYATQFFKALIPLKIKWSGLSTIDVVEDTELFQLMVESGCEGILAGFESTNSLSLKQVSKMTNDISRYQYAVKQFHNYDIPVLGCFVTGFDEDTKESLMETLDMIDEIGIDLPRFSILTPFPGTPLYDHYLLEDRILTQNWDKYDTMHVVFEPKNMSPENLQTTFYKLWKQAYKTKRIIKRLNNTRKEKMIRLGANLGFKYYSNKISKG